MQFGNPAGIEELPHWVMMAAAGIAIAEEVPVDEVDDCVAMIDSIDSIDGGDEMSASHFVERWFNSYDLDTCERALAVIKARNKGSE